MFSKRGDAVRQMGQCIWSVPTRRGNRACSLIRRTSELVSRFRLCGAIVAIDEEDDHDDDDDDDDDDDNEVDW